MKRILIDVNVVLDVLLDRKPFAAAARRAQCDVIVTRNPRDFSGSPVRVLAPPEAAAWLGVAP